MQNKAGPFYVAFAVLNYSAAEELLPAAEEVEAVEEVLAVEAVEAVEEPPSVPQAAMETAIARTKIAARIFFILSFPFDFKISVSGGLFCPGHLTILSLRPIYYKNAL